MAIHVMFLPQYLWPVRAKNRNRFCLPVPVEENINDLNFYKLFGQIETLAWFFEQGTTRTTE
jgi:hypothetical protein